MTVSRLDTDTRLDLFYTNTFYMSHIIHANMEGLLEFLSWTVFVFLGQMEKTVMFFHKHQL